MMMRRGLATVFCVLIMAIPALAEKEQPPKIVVEGEAQVMLEPDYIEWVVLVKTIDLSPAVALETNERMLEALLKIAKGVDIDKEDISSGRPLVKQQYGQLRGRESEGPYEGTEVTRRVTLLMREMDELENLLPQLHGLGLKYVMRYQSTKYEQAIRQAKAAALEHAKEIAIQQAKVIGQKIGPALRVEVVQDYPDRGIGSLFAGIDEPIEFEYSSAEDDGKIHVRAYAAIEFSLEP